MDAVYRYEPRGVAPLGPYTIFFGVFAGDDPIDQNMCRQEFGKLQGLRTRPRVQRHGVPGIAARLSRGVLVCVGGGLVAGR
jgi:acyl-homoserine lactone acylase PvdQ